MARGRARVCRLVPACVLHGADVSRPRAAETGPPRDP
eukprot:gene5625-2640_t